MEFSKGYLDLVSRVKIIDKSAAEYLLNGAVRDADKIDLNTDTAYLMCAFAWCETPQGGAYWEEINSRLIDGIRDKQGETMREFCNVSGNTILLDKGKISICLLSTISEAYNTTFEVKVERFMQGGDFVCKVTFADSLEEAMSLYAELVDELYAEERF